MHDSIPLEFTPEKLENLLSDKMGLEEQSSSHGKGETKSIETAEENDFPDQSHKVCSQTLLQIWRGLQETAIHEEFKDVRN